MIAEERLDLAVESSSLGPGEKVIVITKSGTEVARGCVREVFIDGAVWLESIEGQIDTARVYAPDLYSFVPLEPPEEEHRDPAEGPDPEPEGEYDMPTIAELEFDRRARERMEELGINLEATGDDDEESAKVKKKAGKKKGAKKKSGKKKSDKKKASNRKDKDTGDDEPDDDDEDDDEDEEADADDDDDADNEPAPPPSKREAKASDRVEVGGKKGSGSPETSVDVDALPKSVREKVSKFGDLDDAKADRVLSSISDAAARSLREAGIKDQELYRYVVRIQDAIAPVLGRKSSGQKGR